MSGLVLGTRGSALALAQTHLVRVALAAANPPVSAEIREFKTTGDKRQDLSLSSAVHGDAGEHIDAERAWAIGQS
jgi:porphobilinogen deaminase